jgi:hypothetical protein
LKRPEKISLYYHHEPYGPYWDLIKDRITLVQVPLNEQVSGMSYADRTIGKKWRYAHHADFIRVEKLLEHGGVYADMDTLFLRPLPDELFEHSFVLGREDQVVHQQTGEIQDSLCNAFIMAEPGAEFAKNWLERMPDAMDGSWSAHSCQLAHKLSVEYPQHIHIEPPSSFYPFMWTREGVRALLDECHHDWRDAYSVHLWNHLWWEPKHTFFSHCSHKRMTERYIRKMDTTYTLAARKFLPPERTWPRRWCADMLARYGLRRHA